MSDWWYPFFYSAVILIWLAAPKSDRSAAHIVAAATVGSWLLTRGFVVHIEAAWKLAIPSAVELLTIIALLVWARNRTGRINVGAVSVALFAHVQCYLDVRFGTNVVYDDYENLLMLVAIVQLASFYGTMLSVLDRALVLLHLKSPREKGETDSHSLFHRKPHERLT